MLVDGKKALTPTYSDHSAIIATIILPSVLKGGKKGNVKRWKINDNGLEKFKETTTSIFYTLDKDIDANINYNRWINKVYETIDKCFQKKKVGRKTEATDKSVLPIYNNLLKLKTLGKTQRQVAEFYINKIKEFQTENKSNVRRLKDVTFKLRDNDKFSSNGFWKVAKSLGKKSNNKSSILSHDNTEMFAPKYIIGAYKEEFQYRLRNRKIISELEEYEKTTEELVHRYLNYAEQLKTERKFTLKEMKEVINLLPNNKAPGSDKIHVMFLKNAGDGLINLLLDLCNYMKDSMCIPYLWEKVLITTIFTNKGSKKKLTNYRGIFLSSSKIFEKLIKKRIDKILLNNVNPFQAGARAGRGTADNLFMLRGVIDYYKYFKATIYLTLCDFEQAFDSLWLQDSICSLWNVGVKNELLPLIYTLNEKAVVSVKTPHGLTTEFDANDTVKQGTVLGSNICSTTTAEYCDMNSGVPVGDIMIGPLVFVDDIIKININKDEICLSHAKSMTFSKLKKLTFKKTKCYGIVIDGCKHKVFPQLYIGEHVIKDTQVVYLGDIINKKGNNTTMIKERVRQATAKMISIFAMVDYAMFGTFTLQARVQCYKLLYTARTPKGQCFFS